MQDESAELCFIFHARSVLYFPLENIVPEILLRIHCNKLPLALEANIALGFASRYISLLANIAPLCNISRSALAAVL